MHSLAAFTSTQGTVKGGVCASRHRGEAESRRWPVGGERERGGRCAGVWGPVTDITVKFFWTILRWYLRFKIIKTLQVKKEQKYWIFAVDY